MKQIKTHEIVTWSGRSWPLTKDEYRAINERLEAGARFLSAPDAAPPDYIPSKIAVNDIKFFGKRQMSIGDLVDETKMLPAGEKAELDPLGKGYIKFLVGSIRLRLKKGGDLRAVLKKINEEQKPLVNEELERQGINYSV